MSCLPNISKLRKRAELLIRAEKSRNRNVTDDEEQIRHLWPFMNALNPAGLMEIVVPPRQDRPSRTAET